MHGRASVQKIRASAFFLGCTAIAILQRNRRPRFLVRRRPRCRRDRRTAAAIACSGKVPSAGRPRGVRHPGHYAAQRDTGGTSFGR
jgi:hypothetical protein